MLSGSGISRWARDPNWSAPTRLTAVTPLSIWHGSANLPCCLCTFPNARLSCISAVSSPFDCIKSGSPVFHSFSEQRNWRCGGRKALSLAGAWAMSSKLSKKVDRLLAQQAHMWS